MEREQIQFEHQKMVDDLETVVCACSKEEVLKLNLATLLVCHYVRKPMDNIIFNALFKASEQAGIINFDDFIDYIDQRRCFLEQCPEKPVREENESWGLIHGHYRRFTLAQFMGFVMARRECDKLTVLVESNERTLAYKGRQSLLDGGQRALILLFSGLADEAGEIIKGDYNDEFYREVVLQCRPNVYFGNEEWSKERLDEGRFRAESVGAKFVVLPEVLGFHSSDFEEIFF